MVNPLPMEDLEVVSASWVQETYLLTLQQEAEKDQKFPIRS